MAAENLMDARLSTFKLLLEVGVVIPPTLATPAILASPVMLASPLTVSCAPRLEVELSNPGALLIIISPSGLIIIFGDPSPNNSVPPA